MNDISFVVFSFEEGIRAQINQELADMREQQKDFSESLDDLMDQNDMDDAAVELE